MKKLLLLLLPFLFLTACVSKPVGQYGPLADSSIDFSSKVPVYNESTVSSKCSYITNKEAYDTLVTFLGGDQDEFSEDFKLHLKEQGCSTADMEHIKNASDGLKYDPKAPPVNADPLMNVDHGVVTNRDCYKGTCYVETSYGEIRHIDDPHLTYKNPFPNIGERWLEDVDSYQRHVKTLTVDEWSVEKGLNHSR